MPFIPCECDWMKRDHKTVYVRETKKVRGSPTKAKWVPIGVTCLGCQTIRFNLKISEEREAITP